MRTDNKPQDGFKEIKLAPIHHARENSDAVAGSQSIKLKTLAIAFGLAVLLLSVIVVVFFLPDWVKSKQATDSPQLTNMPSTEIISTQPVPVSGTNTTPTPAIPSTLSADTTNGQASPREQAQDIALRKEAQVYLQDILEKQKTLEENNVHAWAREEYEQGLIHANTGDTFYNQKQFSQANAEYQQTLKILNGLTEQSGVIYNERLSQGQKALDTGDAVLALSAFETASLFTDESGMAAKGLERAQKLDDVFANIELGNESRYEGRLTEAIKAYQVALELDPETKIAKQKLQETSRLLADRQFKRYMTAGYTALEQHKFETATHEFNKALTFKPNSSEAKTALKQTGHQAATFKITSTIQQATEAEKNEQWQNAIELYDGALKLEANLTKAQTGKQRAQRQLRTYQQLEQILSRPERLSDKNVYAETTTYYSTVSSNQNPGPILAKQLNELEKLLQVSATPIKIRLESDNLTDVTVYKVGKMGRFDSKELSIRPGKYVAVGQRDGYRNVRIEFLVTADNKQQVVHIIATEKIN